MDPISHAAFGRTLVALSRSPVPARGVVAAAVLGSLAPDIDAVFMPFGWDRYLLAHEVGTHALIGAVACAVLAGGVVWAFRRTTPFLTLLGAAGVGTFSHLFLDIVSGARLRVLWPFAMPHASLPLVAMADPLLLTLLVAAVIALAIRGGPRQRATAALALTIVVLFLGAKGLLAISALRAYESARPADPVETRVVEAGWGTLRDWTVFDRTSSQVRAWRVEAGSSGAELTLRWPRPRLDGLIATSTTWPTVRNFQGPHDLQLATVAAQNAGLVTVLWSDIRFCWDAATRPVSGDQPLLLGADGRRLACGLWFGGEVDEQGRLVKQVVRVGGWTQTRR